MYLYFLCVFLHGFTVLTNVWRSLAKFGSCANNPKTHSLTHAASSSSTACSVLETTTTISNTIPATSQDANQTSKPRRKKRPPKNQSNTIKPKIEIKSAPHRPQKSGPTEYTTDEEDMIIYDVEDEPEPNPHYVLNMNGFTYKGEMVHKPNHSFIKYDFDTPIKKTVLAPSSEPDLLTTSESEILGGFSYQGVIQVRITIKKNTTVFPIKHLILTFNSPNLPTSIKAGYLHCKIRPYIPNPLRCFKCQRFGRSQTACRGQLTCSRCASVGHASSDCSLEQKCVNCSQPHSADSKLCPKWKIEKEIQKIKTNRNISYIEARQFITPQPSQTYAQVAKSITVNSFSQTDETITKIVCPPLKLLQPLITISKPIMPPSVPAVIKSSTSTQAELIPSTSSVTVASPSKSQPPTSVIDTAPTTSNSLSISAASSSSTACSVLETNTTTSTVSPENLPVSVHNDSHSDHSIAVEAQQFVKRKSRNRRKRPKVQKPDIEIKRVPHRSRNATPTDITTDDEDMLTYDVEEAELEQDPFILPKGYLRALTPSRYRNYRE
ncbi:uncharacterized protein TNCV_4137421 [Trichonephila clavipes]|nr:uncharacterized protein TNCV_4137421 [Trichonephila clavipes]